MRLVKMETVSGGVAYFNPSYVMMVLPSKAHPGWSEVHVTRAVWEVVRGTPDEVASALTQGDA